MTHTEAVEKAKAEKGPAIDMTDRSTALRLIGKTLISPDPKNTNRIEIIEEVNGNYILLINGSDYNMQSVAWALQNLNRMKIAGE
jgi:hypothetical protein